MFGRLVRKELLHHLLDLRFVVVFGLCALLSALSVYVGTRTCADAIREYNVVSETNRQAAQKWLEGGSLNSFSIIGYRWNRRPEVLSPVVFGLSGTLGRQVEVKQGRATGFVGSLYESEPMHALFGVLDFAFIVKLILSLAALLFTYDAVCGEKEAGTLRLYASFPVPRSTLALAKLVGSALSVLVPFLLAFLFAAAVLALSPKLGLTGGDWIRVGLLLALFALYLAVFASFGLWISALTHRRITAFLGLLVLWTTWIFVVPNAALEVALRAIPARSVYDLEAHGQGARREAREGKAAAIDDFRRANPDPDWQSLTEVERLQIWEARQPVYQEIEARWDTHFQRRLASLRAELRNGLRAQQRLATALSAASPLGAVSFVSMDLARTGFVQQQRLEDALNTHLTYLSEFVLEKQYTSREERAITDYAWFTYRDTEPLVACLSRSALYILNLALLAILGFAGAYVTMVRYDVR
ncbi:MAG: ABC transporter permease subunit [Candidatus Latescibacteria bacterium]|nr:ABC transporter permease subunit [Candidatus Latescibacterota bacterium]